MMYGLFFQGNIDGFQHYVFHDEIRVRIRMAAVVAERFWESKVFVGEGGMEVDINEVVRLSISFQAFVDVNDGLSRVFDFWPPNECFARRNGANDGYDAVGLGDIAHGNYVFDHLFGRHPLIVVRHIIGASHDDYSLRMEVDDVRRETYQHLCRGLSTDAPAAEVVVGEKIRMEIGPVFRDGVAHKDHLGVVIACNDVFVVGFKTIEAKPVFL